MVFSRHECVSSRGWFGVRRRAHKAIDLHCAKGLRVCRGRLQRGVALLEVILALSLLLVAMIAIGVIFSNGQYFIENAELRTRALLMTEKLITDLDTGVIVMEEREQSGYFVINGVNESMPGMSWMIEADPSPRIAGLIDIDISVFMGDPEDEEKRTNVMHTRIERAEPRGYDFERDFGLDEDQVNQLTDLIPGGSQLLDPTNFDPRVLAQLPADQLVELLPTLIQAFGGQIGQGQMDQLLNLVNSGNLGNLQNVANQALNQGGQNNAGGQNQGQGQGQGNNGQKSDQGGNLPSMNGAGGGRQR